MRFLSRLGVVGLVGGTVLLGSATVALADDNPPPIEENYDYPGAAKIFADRGILLKKGDGHILLVDCASGSDLLQVRARNKDPFCFRISGATGYLSLELADTYLIRGDSGHTVQATISVDGKSSTVTLARDAWTGVGEGTNPSESATLLEFHASS